MSANRFKLDLPQNGFGYPCNICKHRTEPADACKDCPGYGGPFVVDESEIRGLMERPE